MSDVFDLSDIRVNDHPTDMAETGTRVFVGLDLSDDVDRTVEWLFDPETGEITLIGTAYTPPKN